MAKVGEMGKGYVFPFPKPRADKGLNIMGESPRIKAARQDCFGKIEAFSKKNWPPPRYKRESRNILSSPGKEESPGYVASSLILYLLHTIRRYDGWFQSYSSGWFQSD
ncbi:unnamed protein product [Phaedon cochleariae]|uniref:Uncharacterized protein n=1 Tax=Phaedon cochleariae TaxID=80249 RepID=A0A9N9X3X0_PHACE|nr:unnamed protein product [Phaedon cochleariae]